MRTLAHYFGHSKPSKVIPEFVENPEKLIRIIYSPANLTKSRKGLKSNAFRTPPNKDEVSVLRLNYCDLSDCIAHGRKHQNISQKREYYGLACITAEQVRESLADVVSSPLPNVQHHADIKIGIIPKQGIKLPLKYLEKCKAMSKAAQFPYPAPIYT